MASIFPSLSAFSSGCRLVVAFLVWLLLLWRVHAQTGREDVLTLLSFRHANSASLLDVLDLSYWNTWHLSDENPCSWIGVTCTPNHTVSELDLSDWGLLGELSVGMLSNLSDLRELDLSFNSGINDFPAGIGNLTGLTLLDLSQCNILSPILQDLSALRSLRSLYLQENNFFGEIPTSLGALMNLQVLFLAGNYLNGSIPKNLGELSQLVTLDLSRNSLSGTIPALPNLSRLFDLRLDSNNFTEFEIPWLLGSNSSLERLSVSSNNLAQGTMILSSFASLQNLRLLNMSRNQLSGTIPFGLSRLVTNVNSWLDLSQNKLTGRIPVDLLVQQSLPNSGFCPSLNLSSNLLTGSLPIFGGVDYSCFSSLDLSDNNLSGPISSETFGDLFVGELSLHNNYFSGDIVDVMLQSPGLLKMGQLRLQNNKFNGDLSKIVNMTVDITDFLLEALDLSNNDLRWTTSQVNPDPIQATMERLSSSPFFFEFRVGGNNFSGTSLPKTCFLNQSNEFLSYLDLSNSQLDGEILSGAFDSSCLSQLTYLDVSNNDITGPVPKSIVMLPSLAVLDVSNNHLFGPLPVIPMNSSINTNPRFFNGNTGLCGYPLASCPGPVQQGAGVRWWVLLISVGGSITIALMSCSAATWRWRVYHKRHQQDADLIKALQERDSATLMPLRELRKATDNFAEKAQIGQGGFGTVYLGRLNDGSTVAIKRSKREGSEKDKEQFLNEVRILCNVNHRNLVKLLGCCMEDKIAALVFEYVSNGTLEQHLQGKTGDIRLTWKQRLNIAVQTADALYYLHSAATFPIYHRDVKSANILLNDDLNAKVADFGISRLVPLQVSHVSTVAIQGTIGYIDPEYYTSFQLTDRSDVYSFGVVLLELISAKPAVMDFVRGGEKTSLVNFANSCIERGDLVELIDPALTETYNGLDGHGRESILSVQRLAMACADLRSKARPSMNEVLKELQNLWLKICATSIDFQSIMTDGNEDAEQDDIVFLSESFEGDDTSSFSMEGCALECIQMSQLGCCTNVKEESDEG